MSKDAATPTGAAEGKAPTATEEGRPILRQSRAEMMNSIGRRRVENFNREQKEAGSDEIIPVTDELKGDPDEDMDLEDAEADTERARLEAESKAADAAEKAAKAKAKAEKSEIAKQLEADDRVTVIDDPSKFKVKMKVDGEERLVDLADMTRTAQKEAAADRRLEQAAQMMKAAEAREAEAQAKLAAVDEVGKAKAERDLKAAQEAKEHTKKSLKEQSVRYGNLLYEGKTEEAAELYAEMMAPLHERSEAPTQAAPVIDVKALKAEVKQELKTESALETFAGGYPEIVADQHLAAIADSFFDAERRAGKSEAEAFDLAGKATRGYVKDLAKKLGMSEGRTTTTGRESLEKRKETIDEPESASTSVSLKDNSPQEPNARSIIAEMAASRPGSVAAAAAAKRQAGG